MSTDGRLIKVFIEVELKEGVHFNIDRNDVSDLDARIEAEEVFYEGLREDNLEDSLASYIQSRIIEE